MKRLFVAVPVSEEIKDGIKPLLDALSKIDADLKLVSDFHLTRKSARKPWSFRPKMNCNS